MIQNALTSDDNFAVNVKGQFFTLQRVLPLLGEGASVVLMSALGVRIGAAIAVRLAQDGASVVVNYVKAQAEAEAVAERVSRAGGRAMLARADVGDPTQAARLVQDAVEQMGRLDILVNNAVMVEMGPIGAIDPARVRAQLATNVEGVIATVQAATLPS